MIKNATGAVLDIQYMFKFTKKEAREIYKYYDPAHDYDVKIEGQCNGTLCCIVRDHTGRIVFHKNYKKKECKIKFDMTINVE